MLLAGFTCLSSLIIIEALKCVRMIVEILKLDFVQKFFLEIVLNMIKFQSNCSLQIIFRETVFSLLFFMQTFTRKILNDRFANMR